jgi:hypothetical protein
MNYILYTLLSSLSVLVHVSFLVHSLDAVTNPLLPQGPVNVTMRLTPCLDWPLPGYIYMNSAHKQPRLTAAAILMRGPSSSLSHSASESESGSGRFFLLENFYLQTTETFSPFLEWQKNKLRFLIIAPSFATA